MDLLQELRAATRPQHDRIERSLNLLDDHLTLERYRGLLVRFYGLYVPLEDRLRALGPAPVGALAAARLKTPWLRADLAALGVPADRIELCPHLPDLRSDRRAWGCLYVIEGATLGGKLISAHVRRTLGLTPESGCAFFHSYGSRVGPMWREFRRQLSADASSDRAEVIAGARETFDTFSAWLGAAGRLS